METSSLRQAYESAGPVATALVDISQATESGAHEHELRVRSAADDLRAQGADDTAVTRLADRLEELVRHPAPLARLVVADADGVVHDEVAALAVDAPVATWAALPDLGAWVAHREAALPFVLAVVDHTGGDVAVYRSGDTEPDEKRTLGGETEYVHHVATGGWAMINFQHSTEKVWKDNAEDVVEDIRSRVRGGIRLVLVAGDPQSLALVRRGLDGVQATVVELETGTRAADGGDHALRQAVRDALTTEVVERRLALSREVTDRLGQGSGAVGGVEEVMTAIAQGQVDTVVLDLAATAELGVDPATYPGFPLDPARLVGPIRADLALIGGATLTDARVSVSTSDALAGRPAAAVLRW